MKKSSLLPFVVFLLTMNNDADCQIKGRAQSDAHIFGKIIDEKNQDIELATVILLKSNLNSDKKILLTGSYSDINGEFSFENISMASQLTIQVSLLGYDPYEQLIAFTSSQTEYDLGRIVLKESSKKLDEVVITATIASMQMDVDKKIFNVGSNAVTVGGTAIDVLKNVPSLNVDIDGNVTMRNSAPQILLDGRITNLTPDQIPADAIESIEVISNPSAKFEASGGSGGIVNIVMKKNKKKGYNGNIRIGGEHLGSKSIGFDFNLRQNKINFFSNINLRSDKRITNSELTRQIIMDNIIQSKSIQIGVENQTGGHNMAKLGFDYLLTNKSSITLSGMLMKGDFKPNLDQEISELYLFSPHIMSNSKRQTNGQRKFDNLALVFGFKHLFTTVGDELSIDINFNQRNFNNNTLLVTNIFESDSNTNIESTIKQRIAGLMDNSSFVAQADLIKNIFDNMKLEAGLRANFNKRTTENNNYFFDVLSNEEVLVIAPTSNFKNSDNVLAAYTTVAKQLPKFSYKLGLRIESSKYQGELTKTGENFGNSYPFSLFPSIFTGYKISDSENVQMSVTRRVNRPNFFQNIPFTDSTDRLNITMGNPDLKPEFTFVSEAGYLKRFKNESSLLTSIYYKYTNALISSYIFRGANEVLINSFINANSSYSTGLELTSQTYVSKGFDFNLNLNIYNSKVNLDKIDETIIQPKALWSWFTKFNGNIRLKYNVSLQLSSTYQSKSNIAIDNGEGGGRGGFRRGPQSSSQGYVKAFYNADIAVKKSFAKNKFIVTIGINDIFKSRYNHSFSESIFFTQEYKRITNPQVWRFNLSYNFGKQDAVLFKRKSKGVDDIPD